MLILLVAVANAAKFGSVQTKKVNIIKLSHQYFDALNSGDFELAASFLSEDFAVDETITGRKMGKERTIEELKSFFSSYQSLRYNVNNCKNGKEGEAICSFEVHGKFVKEFLGIPPHHKYIHFKGVAVTHFNDQGLMIRSTTYTIQSEFMAQMQGRTSQKEEILQMWRDWWHRRVPVSHLELFLSKELTVTSPMGRYTSFADIEKIVADATITAPRKSYDWTCDPSAEDFDVWICDIHLIIPIEKDNSHGFKIGATIDIENIAFFTFDQEGKIETVEEYFDLQDFVKQGTTV